MTQLQQELEYTSRVLELAALFPADRSRAERSERNEQPTSLASYLGWRDKVDYLCALILFVATAPLVLLAALAVKLTSRGPVIYSQRRVGLNGRVFEIYKLRSMYHDCERHTGPVWSLPGDRRITPVGWILRASHLDELPQLWNVLRGDMSLIGPRPERPEIVAQLEEQIPGYRKRLGVAPGITGLAQVCHGPDINLASVRRKQRYDLFYLRNVNPGLDLWILWRTGLKALGFRRLRNRERVRILHAK